MAYSPKRFIEYSLSVAQEFQARVSRMRVFVKHNLTSGNANEIILREFLSAHTSGNYDVGQGFICFPIEEGKASRQCDILIYNRNDFPIIYSDGPIKIVWPEAAAMVIEVKTNFDNKDIDTALLNIKTAKALNQRMIGAIFAFNSPKLSTVISNLQKNSKEIEDQNLPDVILLLDKCTIIHRWGLARLRDVEEGADPRAHSIRVGKGQSKEGVVVAFLLLLLLDTVGHFDFVTGAKNMLMQLVEKHTIKGVDDILLAGS